MSADDRPIASAWTKTQGGEFVRRGSINGSRPRMVAYVVLDERGRWSWHAMAVSAIGGFEDTKAGAISQADKWLELAWQLEDPFCSCHGRASRPIEIPGLRCERLEHCYTEKP